MDNSTAHPPSRTQTALEGSQLRARTIGTKGADAPRCKTGNTVAYRGGPVGWPRERSLPPFDSNGEKHLRCSERRGPSRGSNRNECLGRRCGRVQARERASIPSRTHHRRQKVLERAKRKDRTAQALTGRARSQDRAAFTFAPLFRPARFPCPTGPLERCRSREESSRALGFGSRGRASGNHA